MNKMKNKTIPVYNVILWNVNHDQIMQNIDIVTGLFMSYVIPKAKNK